MNEFVKAVKELLSNDKTKRLSSSRFVMVLGGVQAFLFSSIFVALFVIYFVKHGYTFPATFPDISFLLWPVAGGAVGGALAYGMSNSSFGNSKSSTEPDSDSDSDQETQGTLKDDKSISSANDEHLVNGGMKTENIEE